MKHLAALILLIITTFHVAQACSCGEYHLDLPVEAFEATGHLGTYTPADDRHLIFHGKVLSLKPVEFKSARVRIVAKVQPNLTTMKGTTGISDF